MLSSFYGQTDFVYIPRFFFFNRVVKTHRDLCHNFALLFICKISDNSGQTKYRVFEFEAGKM